MHVILALWSLRQEEGGYLRLPCEGLSKKQNKIPKERTNKETGNGDQNGGGGVGSRAGMVASAFNPST